MKEGIGLVRLQVKNLGITKDIVANLLPGINIFQGDNSAGKSTILNSIKYALEGKKAIPADIIRHGFDEEGKAYRAEVVLNTTKFDVKLEVYKGKDEKQKHRLVVKKDGFVRDAPIEFLKSLAKEWNDPKEISDMTNSELHKILMTYAKVDLTKFNQKIEKVKEEQSYLRRKKKELGVLDEVEETKEVDFSDILNEIKEINYFNNEQEDRQRVLNKMTDEVCQLETKTVKINKQIKDLQEMLTITHEELSLLNERIKEAPKPEPKKDISEAQAKLENLERTNEKARQYKAYIEWKEKAEKVDILFNENKKKIKTLEDQKDEAMKKAPMPVEGLGITEEGVVTFDGDTWENCSESDRLTVAAQMIINTTPEKAIRYMVIHQGESILSKRREKLDKQLKENGYTCLMQVASESAPKKEDGVFYIVDGEIKEGKK